MIPKNLAVKFNINAILGKSETERKTFLDKMLDDKANAEKFLEKHGNYLPQKRINELTERLQVLEAKIDQVRKTLPFSYFAKDCLLKLGDVFPVTHQVEGKTLKSLSLVVTEAGVKSCGFDLEEIFKHCPKNKTWQTASTGHIVDMDLYQQLALAEAFVLKYPVLKNNFGFYNLLGSKDVYSVLKDKVDSNILSCFFTGEVFDDSEFKVLGSDDNKYEKSKQRPAAGLVNLSTVKKGTDSKAPFCFHSISDDYWYDDGYPDGHGSDMPLVFGLILE